VEPMEAMKSYIENPPEKEADSIPMEIQQHLYTKFMQNYCEKWLKTQLPALDGETPLQAVKTGAGRRKVINLLKSFENGEEYNKRVGRLFYDLTWM